MEMRSTFHLKFHTHYFKTTLFQYGENQKILMGLIMLFKKKKKRKIKTTKKQKDVAYVIILIKSDFYFTNRKDLLQLFLLYYLLLEREKLVHKVPTGQKVKASVEVTSDLLTKHCSNDAYSSTAPFSPVGFQAVSTRYS